jgi:hypothetical protein
MDRVLSHVPTKVIPTMNGVLKTSFTWDEVKKRYFRYSQRKLQDLMDIRLIFFRGIGMYVAWMLQS